MAVQQTQAAYETIGVASSGYPCIIEVKQCREITLNQRGTWLQSLARAYGSEATLDSARDEQILALP